MSGDVIKEFLVSVGFKVDEAGIAAFSGGLGKATLAVGAIGVAASAMAGVIFNSVKNIAEEYNQLDKLATQFRSTAGSIDEFVDVSGILGISNEVAIGSLKSFDSAILDTSMGLGRAKLVFDKLGISVKDAAGDIKPTTVVMEELSQKFKGMGRGEQIRIMERLGLDPILLKVFNADLGAMRKELEGIDLATGFDLGNSIEQSKAFTATWKDLLKEINFVKLLFTKAIESIAVKMMPKFRDSIENVKNSLNGFRKMATAIMPKIIDGIMPVIGVVMRIAEAFITIAGRAASAISGVLGWLGKVNDATGGWAGYILAAAVAWKFLNLSFLASPIGIILALAAAIALLVDDFMTWKDGGESLINWGEWKNEIDLAMALIDGFKAVLVDTFQAIFAAIDAVVSLLTGDWAGAWSAVKSMIGSIGGMFSGGSDSARGLSVTPQSAAAMTPGAQNVTQKTEIVVQGGNADATARAVAGQQSRVNADMARNMKGAAS